MLQSCSLRNNNKRSTRTAQGKPQGKPQANPRNSNPSYTLNDNQIRGQ